MPLKRKRADRSDWRRVTKRAYAQLTLTDEAFEGHVSLLRIDEVREPLHGRTAAGPLLIADKGYQWMLQIPAGRHHAVTTMFDPSGRIVQWYIDMYLRSGTDDRGVAWFDDLFLDLVAVPDGGLFIKDVDELREALRDGDIEEAEYVLAWREMLRVKAEIEQGVFAPFRLAKMHRERLITELERQAEGS
ncbi:hypothetical protein J31TS4_43820 [Paenibacillus sp. J31TS4]|uniref:DUF402 domain-containing protein n=1 Tax=Paenibacillus sp. J31TS4 TaxID=2807195 RepID=UPI001B16ABE7|nr:DUF402 domain-containing protein [Paenibacillus sp. J31TS4]GIP41102.1 hypothetical protein J31TS4_43820 [Paenibacillus sp. J31TS4]